MDYLEHGIIEANPFSEVWGLRWRSMVSNEFNNWLIGMPIELLKSVTSLATNFILGKENH